MGATTTAQAPASKTKRRPRKDRNKVELVGHLAVTPDIREFESGARLARLLVKTATEYERRRTDVIPVTVWDPDQSVVAAVRDDLLTVKGMVQRRFWQGHDGRESRVEVVALDVTNHGQEPTG